VKVQRIPSGNDQLDEVLEGGFPHPSIIGLLGPHQKSREFGMKFLQKGVDVNEKGLFITTKDDIQTIDLIAQQYGIDPSSLIFLDAVHWRTKRFNPSLETRAEFTVSNLTDLNALLTRIIDVDSKHKISRIYLDTFSSLLMYSTPGKEQVFKFFELLSSFTRSKNISLVYYLSNEMHVDEVYATMKFLSDGALSISSEGIAVDTMILSDLQDHQTIPW